MVGGSLSHSNDGKMPSSLVLAQTWHTRIPVHLSLATDNISSPSAVRPIYVSRITVCIIARSPEHQP